MEITRKEFISQGVLALVLSSAIGRGLYGMLPRPILNDGIGRQVCERIDTAAKYISFEPNCPATQEKLASIIRSGLASVRGIEKYHVFVWDDPKNETSVFTQVFYTKIDALQNKHPNGTFFIVDAHITASGAQFV